MKRLEVKEQSLCNFNAVMKGNFCYVFLILITLYSLTWLPYFAEYKSVHDSFKTADYYARNVCLRVCAPALMIYLS